MTEKEIQKELAFARFNFACEGMEITADDEAIGRKILEGKITGEEAVFKIIKKLELTKK